MHMVGESTEKYGAIPTQETTETSDWSSDWTLTSHSAMWLIAPPA